MPNNFIFKKEYKINTINFRSHVKTLVGFVGFVGSDEGK